MKETIQQDNSQNINWLPQKPLKMSLKYHEKCRVEAETKELEEVLMES